MIVARPMAVDVTLRFTCGEHSVTDMPYRCVSNGDSGEWRVVNVKRLAHDDKPIPWLRPLVDALSKRNCFGDDEANEMTLPMTLCVFPSRLSLAPVVHVLQHSARLSSKAVVCVTVESIASVASDDSNEISQQRTSPPPTPKPDLLLEECEAWKKKGNAHYSSGFWDDAIHCYYQAATCASSRLLKDLSCEWVPRSSTDDNGNGEEGVLDEAGRRQWVTLGVISISNAAQAVLDKAFKGSTTLREDDVSMQKSARRSLRRCERGSKLLQQNKTALEHGDKAAYYVMRWKLMLRQAKLWRLVGEGVESKSMLERLVIDCQSEIGRRQVASGDMLSMAQNEQRLLLADARFK